VALNVFKASSKIVAVPFELLQDSQIDIQAMVFKRLADRIGRISNTGFTVGGGTVDPNGLVTAATVGKTGTTGQTLTIIYDDLVDLIDSLDVAYLDIPSDPSLGNAEPAGCSRRRCAACSARSRTPPAARSGCPSYDEGLTSKSPDRLLGYPVYLNNDMAVPAANAKSLAFGNLNKYMIRDAMELTMFRFDDSAYAKLGQVGFLAWARTGGNLMDVNAVKLYQHRRPDADSPAASAAGGCVSQENDMAKANSAPVKGPRADHWPLRSGERRGRGDAGRGRPARISTRTPTRSPTRNR
jgi:hypothetical protein